MKPFEYVKVTSVAQAVSLLAKHQEKASILAGGSDLLGIMKDRLEGPKLKMPQSLIDIKGIKDLNYVREQKGRGEDRRNHHPQRDHRFRSSPR